MTTAAAVTELIQAAFTRFGGVGDAGARILRYGKNLHQRPDKRHRLRTGGEVPGKRWIEYMAEDIVLIDECDGIFLLPNWQQSKGAKFERYLCELLGKPIYYAASEIAPARLSTSIFIKAGG